MRYREIDCLSCDGKGFSYVMMPDPETGNDSVGESKCYSCNGHGYLKVLDCGCGTIVYLTDPMTNHCPCGRMYNGSGQELAPTSQWGAETGEVFNEAGDYLYGGDY